MADTRDAMLRVQRAVEPATVEALWAAGATVRALETDEAPPAIDIAGILRRQLAALDAAREETRAALAAIERLGAVKIHMKRRDRRWT